MDVTWHSGPRGSTTRAHPVPTRRCDICIIYIYMGYSTYSLLIIGRGLLTLLYVAYYIRIHFPYFICVGLRPTQFFCAGHVAKREVSDRRRIGNPRVDRVDSRSTGSHQRTCFNSKSYNGSDETSEERIATVQSRSKGRNSRRFINASQTLHPNGPSRSNGHDIFETVHGGSFNRNRRSF